MIAGQLWNGLSSDVCVVIRNLPTIAPGRAAYSDGHPFPPLSNDGSSQKHDCRSVSIIEMVHGETMRNK